MCHAFVQRCVCVSMWLWLHAGLEQRALLYRENINSSSGFLAQRWNQYQDVQTILTQRTDLFVLVSTVELPMMMTKNLAAAESLCKLHKHSDSHLNLNGNFFTVSPSFKTRCIVCLDSRSQQHIANEENLKTQIVEAEVDPVCVSCPPPHTVPPCLTINYLYVHASCTTASCQNQ
ncbi:hypothetical protein INR49_016717 [Caranx melampygus]|nr:hypothetical protein INR49_016717 [Caranx melampygus]